MLRLRGWDECGNVHQRLITAVTRDEKLEISQLPSPQRSREAAKAKPKISARNYKEDEKKRLESDFGIILLFDQIICVYLNVYLF